MKYFIGLLSVAFILTLGCTDLEITHEFPAEFRNLDFDYSDNDLELAIDNDKAVLGRVLFYDKMLSLNGNVSCASCHKQEFAFGDNIDLSAGFLDGDTKTNSPTLINAHFNSSFFWDSRSRHLTSAVTLPIFDPTEMGMTLEDLVLRVNNTEHYSELIKAAFPELRRIGPDGMISFQDLRGRHIGEALAEFVSTIITVDSKFDQSQRLPNEDILSKDELAGLELFEMHCNACHSALGDSVQEETEDDTDTNPYLGLPDVRLVSIGLDPVDGRQTSVRIPTLRNIDNTGPYMHDGRFETLQEVIEHYNDGVRGPLLDERLRDEETGLIKRLDLTDEEKMQLESFLLTLSDDKILLEEKWSDPFIRR